MSTTRLLVLGVVRIFQPVHGYFVRRELLSWDIERWANINPGSIYNALRTLTREGFLVESEESPTDARTGPAKPVDRGAKQSRTTYRLTPDGQNEFVYLLRDSLWKVDQWDNSTLLGGLSFVTYLRRDEVVDALETRADALRGLVSASQHTIRDFTERRAAPPHTAEHLLVTEHRWSGELAWCEQFLQRVRDGYYLFSPEPGWDAGPARDGTWPGPTDKPSSQS